MTSSITTNGKLLGKRRFSGPLLFHLILMLFAIGCTNQYGVQNIVISPISEGITDTAISINPTTETKTPISTSASLSVDNTPETSPSATPDLDIWTPIPNDPPLPISPTFVYWTPVPTLNNSDAHSVFENWMSGSTGCGVPCWGITPGITTLSEAHYQISKIILSIGGEYEIIANGKCVYGNCKAISWTVDNISGNVTTYVNDDIYGISINFPISTDGNEIMDILEKFGVPSKVYISTGASVFDEMSPFDLVLVYFNESLVVRYFWNTEVIDDKITACVQENPVDISMGFGDSANWSASRVKLISYGWYGINPFSFKELETVTELSLEDFYYAFREDQNACIATPVDLWP